MSTELDKQAEQLLSSFEWNDASRDGQAEILAAFASQVREQSKWVSVADNPASSGMYATYPPHEYDKQHGLTFAPRYFEANENQDVFVGGKLAYGWVASDAHEIEFWQPLPAPPSTSQGQGE